ncbi:MAG: DoxX family protein [Leptospirales bacterium]|nr:DoxX family protein [Leptospirales bacterium]
MLEKIFTTESTVFLTIVRIVLGGVMLPHGLQKLLGWFGGFGFRPTIDFFVSLGIPAPIGLLVIVAESFGALALILGFCTRPAAAGLAIVMIGAALMQAKNGFFMNWFGSQAGEGYEYHILIIGMCAALLISGAGAFSVDRALVDRFR